jgi:hypothetical protein
MFFTFKLFSIASLVTAFLVSSITAQWPKRGLAANDDIPIWQFGGYWEGAPSEVNWQYNWGSTTDQKQSFCEYVPMLWGDDAGHTNSWFSDASYWLADGGSGHLLAFNEPEQSDQSNISPQDAANAYRTWMSMYPLRKIDLHIPSVGTRR